MLCMCVCLMQCLSYHFQPCIPLSLLTESVCTLLCSFLCLYASFKLAERTSPRASLHPGLFFCLCIMFLCISWQMQSVLTSHEVHVCEAWLSALVGWTRSSSAVSRAPFCLLEILYLLLESALSRSPHAGFPSPVFT